MRVQAGARWWMECSYVSDGRWNMSFDEDSRPTHFVFQFPSEDVPATEPIVRHESSFGQLSKANCFDSINFRPNKSLKRNESTMCIKRTLKAKHSSRWFKIASESRFSFCAEFLWKLLYNFFCRLLSFASDTRPHTRNDVKDDGNKSRQKLLTAFGGGDMLEALRIEKLRDAKSSGVGWVRLFSDYCECFFLIQQGLFVE